MGRYRVWVRLEEEYDDIEAGSAEEAFIIASDAAMEGGCWSHEEELIDGEQDDDESEEDND